VSVASGLCWFAVSGPLRGHPVPSAHLPAGPVSAGPIGCKVPTLRQGRRNWTRPRGDSQPAVDTERNQLLDSLPSGTAHLDPCDSDFSGHDLKWDEKVLALLPERSWL
jgi:hypothetical protein